MDLMWEGHIDSPRFDGTGCWQQHLLKSNGWSPDTSALQLFAHLDGEALKVALLMPGRIRERWKDLVDELSAYYNTPGRLAVIRRQFENARRRPGLDPATFATELGISGITRKRDADVECITTEGDAQFGGQRAPHTKHARSCGSTPEG